MRQGETGAGDAVGGIMLKPTTCTREERKANQGVGKSRINEGRCCVIHMMGCRRSKGQEVISYLQARIIPFAILQVDIDLMS
jgi:hypothetical protein